MLAKMWKQVLLAICIVACIFNIMSKLVNRHSLKENLDSANDGITVFNIFKKDDVQVTETETIIDGVVNQEVVNNTVSNETISEEVIETNETTEQNVVENQTEETENQVVEEKTENEEEKTFKFSDFTIIF